uniref:Uncharacterized protein n=1 Tax=Calcidiscus leptoporus TaxID=127549 RepID=A0A7S0NT78_9EUKA|mmetsp:Transcript_2507/g.5659  ORF Transcript_2507/g.5659 Transcript_2507/m.5659 type:complete len:184 (+) Transcript_2507:72-623(+)
MERPESMVLRALQQRNLAMHAACRVTDACEGLLSRSAAVQADLLKQQQRADGLVKEKAEMEADLTLLRQNEVNAGVSREHIEVLQQQLELAKSEAAHSARQSIGDASHRQAAEEAAQQLGEKLSMLREELADTRAERDSLQTTLVRKVHQRESTVRRTFRLCVHARSHATCSVPGCSDQRVAP